MAAPPAYLDEDLPGPAADALRMRGFTVLTTLEAYASMAPDEAQLLRATELGYVLISHKWNACQQALIHGLRLPGYAEADVLLVLGRL